ncbi:MAG: hypothetical protein GC192_00105 [Bacteroidetes bacterium]|nr:hypothetical protein [Bacteroidota bacterium]
MNRILLTLTGILFCISGLIAGNPNGDLKIEMLDYYNLVVDHNIQTPNGASPRAVYIGVKICNTGNNPIDDVFANIGNFSASTPGEYPVTTISSGPYSGNFSFTHEGGIKDATRYIGTLAPGECVVQYWLLSYPLLDLNGNKVCGSKPDQTDDLKLKYDVWATANDAGVALKANDSKTVQCRAMISAMANKIWPNTTSKVPNEFLAAFPDKQLGWRQNTPANGSVPGSTIVLEGIWFDLGNIRKGFDNDGDYVPDYNFLLQPVGNPALFDANCFRLVKVHGLIVIKLQGQGIKTIEFTDKMHFSGIPEDNTGAVGMVYYEFAVLNGPCSSQLTPYQEVASGSNNEKHNGDYGTPGGSLTAGPPSGILVTNAPASTQVGQTIQVSVSYNNNGNQPIGLPNLQNNLVYQVEIPDYTAYVAGSAASSNSLPNGTNATLLYSSDGGLNWETTEPTPAATITDIQWWLDKPLEPGQTGIVTYDIAVSSSYNGTVLKPSGGVGLGNSTPFVSDEAAVMIEGNYSITGKVFTDNGDGNGGILGDGIQNGAESGIPNVTVWLYVDSDGDGIADENELIAQTAVTQPNGSFAFDNLSDANYVVKINTSDNDIPDGLSSTTASEIAVGNLNNGSPTISVGFTALVEVTNSLAGNSSVYENDIVNYDINVKNRTYAEDTDNSSSVVAWASVLDPSTTYNITPNNMLGPPDDHLANFSSNWSSKAVVKGFNFGTQQGEIEKVELLFSLCTDRKVNNDKLQAKITLENGTTVVVPNPIWSKNSSPSLNDYVGVPYLGFLTVDLSDVQDWDWSVFDPEWKVTIEGVQYGSYDGARVWIDAIGVKVTTTCCTTEGVGEPGDCISTVQHAPFSYKYDTDKLEFISASDEPDELNPGELKWEDVGPLYPGQTKNFNLSFRALQPELSSCALSAPECLSIPNPWTQCEIASSGYSYDKTVNGNVTWSSILSSVPTNNVATSIRLRGTGTITVPSGDLVVNAAYFVVDGPTLVIANGNLILNQYACVLFHNGTFRVKGNVDQSGNQSFFCNYNETMEIGDEASNGFFNSTGVATTGYFKNNGGNRRLENVCLNVTSDYTLLGSSGLDYLINVCGEIGDKGATNAASGTVDAGEGGSISISANCTMFTCELTVVGNIGVNSGGTLMGCNSDFRTTNGNFSNAGTFKGCDNTIWVNDGKSITNTSNWTAVVAKRRGNSSMSTAYIPVNSSLVSITPEFGNCTCAESNSANGLIVTTAKVEGAKNCENLDVQNSSDTESITVLDRGSISGIIYGDKDNDGWQGATGVEPGVDYYLEGVEIKLFACVSSNGRPIYPASNTNKRCDQSPNNGSWEVLQTDTTNENGFYRFEGLENGYYYTEVTSSTVPGKISQSADPDQTGVKCTSCNDTWKNSTDKISRAGIIGGANDFYEVNFGYYLDELISGKVYNDINGNGIIDEGDVPMQGVTVKRVSGGCSSCPTTVTDATGKFVFGALSAGTSYNIQVVISSLPAGNVWLETYESDGTINNSIVRTLAAGTQSTDNIYGFRQAGASDIGGTVYYDWHGNAFINAGDEGIPDVKLNLFRDSNNNGVRNPKEPIVGITTTDINGKYNFGSLPAGSYIVLVDEATLPIYPYETEDPSESGICSICDAQGEIYNLNGTADRTDIDFGYTVSPASRPNARVQGVVFEDADANGIRHFSEFGLPGISVSLVGDVNGDGIKVAMKSKTSAFDGSYYFEALLDGDYSVVVTEDDDNLPLHYKASTLTLRNFRIAGGKLIEIDGINCVTCAGASIDFGFTPAGSIESYVFFDANGNGTQDWSEKGIVNAIVYLCEGEDVACTLANASKIDTTDANGLFVFEDLASSYYTVAVELASLPTGLTLTADPSTDGIPCYSPLDIADPYYSFLNAGCDSRYGEVRIYLGSKAKNVNFGYKPSGIIGDLVWVDYNLDGVQGSNEPGIPRVEIRVVNATSFSYNGTNYTPGTYRDTIFTDFDGIYSFVNLPDATWTVNVVAPVDLVPVFDPDGTLNNTTQVVISNGKITNIGNSWCLTGSNCSLDVDFGYRPNYTNSVSGTVCLDADSDGQCDPLIDDVPNNITVFVYDERGNELGQKTADHNGDFIFEYLPNDTVIVAVSMTQTPLELTSVTTSTGDTPAFEVEEVSGSTYQKIDLTGDVTGVNFAFAFTDTFDLGDLPLPYLTTVNGTRTGPAHLLEDVPTLFLGSWVDAEFFPVINDDASGDDSFGDDEDGISFINPDNWKPGTVALGKGGSISAKVTGNGYLVGWIDFSQDGDFTDPGEMIVNQVVSTGNYNFNFDIPASTDLSGGQEIYSRFRVFVDRPFSPETACDGIVVGGEVEDYRTDICHNLTDPGAIVGAETGCDGFDASIISESAAPAGGGGTLEYQWQMSLDDGLTWADITGATGTSYDPGSITQTTRYRRGALREHCAGFVYTNAVIKTVLTNFDDPGIIAGDEDNCGIFDPTPVLSVTPPSGGSGTGTVTYQWQQSTDGGTTWMDIASANQESYDPGIISVTTNYRRTSRKAPCGDLVYSNVVTKMVAVNFTNAGTIAGAESICGGYDPGIITSVSLPTGGVDGYVGYQWERSIDGGNTWSVIPGATSTQYNPGTITQTTQYRRQARRVPCGIWVNSNVIVKEVKTIPTASITTFPTSGSGNLCELTDYVFAASNAGSGVTYSWDFGTYATSPSGAGQGPLSVQFDVPNGSSTTSTTVKLTVSENGCQITDSKVLSLRPEIVINSVSKVNPTSCSATDGSITIMATYPASSTIVYSINGGATWTSSSFIDNLGAGVYEVMARYNTGDCAESYGNVSLSDPPPAATMSVSSLEECTGQSFTVSASAATGSPVYGWFFGNGASPSSASGAGPHNVTFSTGGPKTISLQLKESGCVAIIDTTVVVVENFSDGGSVLGGGVLCSAYDAPAFTVGSNPAGGYGGSTLYQWEKRTSTGPGTWDAWTDIAGATSATYDPGNVGSSTEYRRKTRRNPCSSWVYSNTLTTTLVLKPVLGDDNYFTVCPGFPYADNVNINDYSLSNPSFNILTWPTNGALDFDNDGEILYVPNSTYCGTDHFKYYVCNEGSVCCDTASVIIDLTDNEAPTIANVPPSITISCDDQLPLAESVAVVENCQNVSIGVDQFITQGSDSCALHNYEYIRMWNGVDYCTNTAQATQVITVQDKTSPDIYRIYTLPNGKKLVAGVMENVSEYWKTVALPVAFNTQPVVFTQLSSRNEASAAIVRMRNVSTTQFQIRIQEEEAADGTHLKENVAWIAFEKGAISGSVPFEVNTWLLNNATSTKTFAQAYPGIPNFIASVQTNNDSDLANLRYSNLTSNAVNVKLQEETSADAETTHNLETVGYLAIYNSAQFKTNTGEVFGEVGKVSVTQDIVKVDLQNKYHNPVVIVGGTSYNDSAPVTVRVFDVTETSFQVKLDEFDYEDGVHSVETLSYLVVEGSLPLDKFISCDNIPAPLAIGTQIIAKDNCDATIMLRMVENTPNFDCASDTILTRTWSVVDDCGNETSLTETYTLRDTEAPTFVAPANVTIVCGANKDDLTLTGIPTSLHDNCADEVFPVYGDDMTNLLGCNGYILRTWTVEDNCGNITSKVQIITIAPPTDTDRDGVTDFYDLDDDNDGIPDAIEGTIDSDGDGIPNSLDLDSDNDGIPDLIETGRVDINGDGVIDIVGTPGWDHDHDGFAFGYDGSDISSNAGASVTFDPGSLTNDRDQDGVPNYLDLDSDNDGIPDLVEVGGADVNGDGVIDYPIPNDPTSMPDIDSDGFHDSLDSDDDGVPGAEATNQPFIKYNGIAYTGGLTSETPDFDGDGVPNFLDSDSDNDGVPDLIEAGGVDTDGDGKLKLNGYFVDNNNDGLFDIYVTNSLIRTEAGSSSGNLRPHDYDNNGTAYIGADADFDGMPNHVDRDSDGDHIYDILEAGLSSRDLNKDGVIDNFTDGTHSGFDDLIEASGNIITEQDGATFDGRPEDSGDADDTPYLSTQADGAFGIVNGNPDVDEDGDGLLNLYDVDSDNDLIMDYIEDKNFNGTVNVGETNLYNPDSDFDAIRDGIEDRNRNGKRDEGETDPLNPNTDGDLLDDGEEDDNKDGIVDAGESSALDPCDPYLSDACKGVAVNVRVKLLGPLVGNTDTVAIMRDDLREKLFLTTTEPYTKLTHINHVGVPDDPNTPTTGGSTDYKESITPGLLYITGLDAPVDWVLVELRSASYPDSVIASRAGILQADGDVRDVNDIDYLVFPEVRAGEYFVSVRHRNHLGVMTEDPYLLTPTITNIDFTDPTLHVYGNDSRYDRNGEMTFWPGDFNNDGSVIYQGPANDITYLFQTVLLYPSNTQTLANFIVQGYKQSDLNLDGQCIYQGPNNDRAMVLINAILASPENVLHLGNFIVHEKLP